MPDGWHMKRNVIRIVCDPYTNRISYFFKNESGEWTILSGSSPLSRQYYTRTTIKERCRDIIKKLDEVYNRKNKGLDLLFEGTSANYANISNTIKTYFPDRDIICNPKTTKIAVIGKRGCGKTTLIEGIANEKGYKFENIKKDRYIVYMDKRNNINWIEVNGIDYGENEVSMAASAIRDLVKEDLSTVIYCISGDSGRIEDTEKRFIEKINSNFSSITVLMVLTKCYKEAVQDIIDEAEKLTGHINVFPTLAKEYKVSERVQGTLAPFDVAPFGIKELCAFIFEGKKLSHQFQDALKAATIHREQKKDTVQKKLDSRYIVNDVPIHNKKADSSGTKLSKASEMVKDKPSNEYGDIYAKKEEYEKEPVEKAKPIDKPEQETVFKKVAIVGKQAAGKTTLIEGIGSYTGQIYHKENCAKYTVYIDRKSKMEWYEVKGIELGKDKIEEIYAIVKDLIANGVKTIFYCISGSAGKIEDAEISLIKKLTTGYPQVSVVVILTMCYKEDSEDIADTIQKAVGKIEIIQTLAKDYKTKIKIPGSGENLIISSFGLGVAYRYANGDR